MERALAREGIDPPAGFGVEAGATQSVSTGPDIELQGRLLGADSNDSRVSILWRFLDKVPGDTARFADPTRLRILFVLCERGEATVTELMEATGQSQSNVSRHLAYLYRSGVLLVGERRGQHTYHWLDNREFCQVLNTLMEWVPRDTDAVLLPLRSRAPR